MALNRSPEFKVAIVQIVCVVEIQSESAWALTNIVAMPNFMHLRRVVLKKISLFFCVFLWFKPRTPWGESILNPDEEEVYAFLCISRL